MYFGMCGLVGVPKGSRETDMRCSLWQEASGRSQMLAESPCLRLPPHIHEMKYASHLWLTYPSGCKERLEKKSHKWPFLSFLFRQLQEKLLGVEEILIAEINAMPHA